MSVAAVSLWIACLAIGATYLSLVQAISVPGAFWFMPNLSFTLLRLAVTHETKGRSPEEIEQWCKRGLTTHFFIPAKT